MGLLDILFGGGNKKNLVPRETRETRGEHMPDLHIPIDEKFTINFKKNGGKFIYCDSYSELSTALGNIVEENNWHDTPFFALNPQIREKFERENITFNKNIVDSEVFFTTCEHLVAQNGSILVCQNQLLDRKLSDLPKNLLVYATTSQLVGSIGEGLKIIKNKYAGNLPANITTIKHFLPTEENSNNFLTYGSSSKNLYLLLLEDL